MQYSLFVTNVTATTWDQQVPPNPAFADKIEGAEALCDWSLNGHLRFV